jgi:ribose transport system permease protein
MADLTLSTEGTVALRAVARPRLSAVWRSWVPLAPVIGAAVLMLAAIVAFSKAPLSYFQVASIASGMAPLALAAIGQTIVILGRGFDLSAGATLSFTNVVVATHMGDSLGSQLLWGAIGLLIAVGVGAVNGYFIAYRRLQPIVVTLATMFMLSGVDLMALPSPGGNIPPDFAGFFVGDVIPGLLPAPFAHIALGLFLWWLVKRSRFGTALYAVGGNEEAATAQGVQTAPVKLLTYMFAGLFYGFAGLMISANTGSGDPLGGNAMLLFIFAAVIIGGVRLGGGRGTCLGPVIASFILMQISSLMLVLNVSANLAPLFQGVIVLLSIAGACLRSDSPLPDHLRRLRTALSARRHVNRPRQSASLVTGQPNAVVLANDELTGSALRRFLQRNRDTLSLIAPVYVLILLTLVISLVVLGHNVLTLNYINSMLVLTLLVALLSLGQGAVVMAGGMDLSMGQTVTLCGVLAAGLYPFVGGVFGGAVILVLAICAIGALIGLVNAVGTVFLGIPAVIMTVGMNGILFGLTLLYTNGVPVGTVPPAFAWLFRAHWGAIEPAALLLVVLVCVSWLLLSRTTLGWRILAVGGNTTVARLSGVSVPRVVIGAFVLSSVCSALVGMLLIGYSGSAILNMGEPYLLPTLASVFIGGTLATGGRGHYVGIFGGALLLTLLGTLVTGANFSHAVRQIIFGIVVLVAVLWLQESDS